jgi:drug/metabolite transporter (DMT)-like permease
MHVIAQPDRWRLALALAAVYLAWGGTYPAIRVMVETAPPLLSTGVRFLVAGVLLYGWLLARGGRARVAVPRREALGAAAVGSVILGDIGLLAVAEQEVPAGLAALIIASVPLSIVLLRVAHGERPARTTLAAVAAGLAGVALLVAPGAGGAGPPLVWLLVLVGAAAVEAAGQFYSPRAPLPRDALVSTALQLLAAGLFLSAAGVAAGELGALRPERFSAESLAAFTYLVVPGSLLAYAAFVWLLANVPISTVSTYAYVNPVVAVIVGWALLSEAITPSIAAGAVAVLAAVALIVRDRPRAGRSGTPRSRSSRAARPARAARRRR